MKSQLNTKFTQNSKHSTFSARWGDENLVRVLLDRKSDVNAENIDSQTALHFAVDNGSSHSQFDNCSY